MPGPPVVSSEPTLDSLFRNGPFLVVVLFCSSVVYTLLRQGYRFLCGRACTRAKVSALPFFSARVRPARDMPLHRGLRHPETDDEV